VRWLELSIQAPSEYAEPVAHLFSRHGDGRVVTEETGGYNPDEGESAPPNAPVTVRGYLPLDPTTESRRTMIDVGLRLISQIEPLPPMEERVLDSDEWERQEFEPVRVGEKLVVVPSACRWRDDGDRIAIPIEPGLAFGTGHHPTTRMCLALLEQLLRPGARVVDVGCGSGILSIAAVKLGAAHAVCLDVEADAVESTRRNALAAGVPGALTVAQGSLPDPLAPPGEFDVALANISAKVLIDLAGLLLASLAPDGVLLGSGVMSDRLQEVMNAFTAAGGEAGEVITSGDWVALPVRRSLPARNERSGA